MNRPNPSDDQRAFKIRCAGRRGDYIAPDDLKWIYDLYKKYPEWVKELDDRAFEATIPYGSTFKKKP